MATRHTRREFLEKGLALAGTAAAAGLARGPYVMAADAPTPKLGVAVVGAGGMGGYSVGCARRERLVALVDIDDRAVARVMKDIEAKDEGPKPKVYSDYRKMLDACHKDLDAVLVATPDHHHAPAAIRAIQLGKAAFASWRRRPASTKCPPRWATRATAARASAASASASGPGPWAT